MTEKDPYTVKLDDGRSGYTEAGIYRRAILEPSEENDPFTEWVCTVVLPEIRRHGVYSGGFFQDRDDDGEKGFFSTIAAMQNCQDHIEGRSSPAELRPLASFRYKCGIMNYEGHNVTAVRDLAGNLWVGGEDLFRCARWLRLPEHAEAISRFPALSIPCEDGDKNFFALEPLNEYIGGRLEEFQAYLDILGRGSNAASN